MNYSRILSVLNIFFISCGYQAQCFQTQIQKFKLTLVGLLYLVLFWLWYAICFQQHFMDTSIFNFLLLVARPLHKIIRMHLFMGIKIFILTLLDMRSITRALNDLIKALPSDASTCWSWSEFFVYICMFSGILLNLGFLLYIMITMEFLTPTLQQIMHGIALFLPHYALASSFKLLNVTSIIVKMELQFIRKRIKYIYRGTVFPNDTSAHLKKDKFDSFELTVIPRLPNDSNPLKILSQRAELLADGVNGINNILQKQMMFLFAINSVSLLGATYLIVYYYTNWITLLEGPLGNSLVAFNIGVFVFIAWDYLIVCIVNCIFENERKTFLADIYYILKQKSSLEQDCNSYLKDIKRLLKHKFKTRIFFIAPIKWQTFVLANTLIGLAISIFMIYHYFDDLTESLKEE